MRKIKEKIEKKEVVGIGLININFTKGKTMKTKTEDDILAVDEAVSVAIPLWYQEDIKAYEKKEQFRTKTGRVKTKNGIVYVTYHIDGINLKCGKKEKSIVL